MIVVWKLPDDHQAPKFKQFMTLVLFSRYSLWQGISELEDEIGMLSAQRVSPSSRKAYLGKKLKFLQFLWENHK